MKERIIPLSIAERKYHPVGWPVAVALSHDSHLNRQHYVIITAVFTGHQIMTFC